VKAFWTASPDEGRRRFREAHAAGLAVVAQEYIPGPADACYLVDGFLDRDGRLRGLLTRQKLRIYPTDFGNPSYQVSIPRADIAPAVDDVLALLGAARYRGVFSALVKRDKRDGTFKILEVNARPYWYIDFTRRCGVDLAWLYYRDALGEEVPEMLTFAAGKRCMYPYYDVQAVRSGAYSLGPWLRDLVGAWQPVFRWSDPLPAAAGAAKILRERVAARLFRRR
jgi:predicted ATP-grasp superfamily ATP-dependent carboligase